MPQIPDEVRAFVAAQLGLLWDSSESYSWHGSTLDYHLAQIRQHSGWRFPTAQDKEELENWLRNQGAKEAHTADALFDSACERLRSLRVELPAEGELERVVNAALNGFFQDIYRQISDALAPEARAGIDALLVVPASTVVSGFEGLKADPGKAGVDNLQAEIEKLTRIRAIGVGTGPFAARHTRNTRTRTGKIVVKLYLNRRLWPFTALQEILCVVLSGPSAAQIVFAAAGSEVRRDIVKSCVSGTGASLLK